MTQYTLPVEIEMLEEGGYLAICPAIPGCHAEGASIGEVLDNLREVARVLYDLSVEKGLLFVPDYPDAKPQSSGVITCLENETVRPIFILTEG